MAQYNLNFEKKLGLLEWMAVLLLFIMPLWPPYIELSVGGMFTITPPRFLIGLWFFIAAFTLVAHPSRFSMGLSAIRANKIIIILILTFFSLRFVSSILSKQPTEALNFVFRTEVVGHLSLFIIGIFSIRSIRAINFYCMALVLSGGIAIVFGVFEYIYEKNPLTDFVRGNSDYALMLTMDKSRDGQFRAQSTFEHPLLFGQFLIFVWAFGLYYMQILNGSVKKFIPIIFHSLFTIGVLISNTRSSLICFMLEYVIFYNLVIRSAVNKIRNVNAKTLFKFTYWLGIVVIAFGILPVLIDVGYGKTEIEKGSASIRFEMLEKGFEALSDIFWLGNGVGSGAKLLNFTGAQNIVTLDNLYLLYALESGVPAALVFILILFFGIWLAWSKKSDVIPVKNSFNNLQIVMGLALLVFSATALISSLMSVLPYVYATLAMLCWIRKASAN